MGTLYALKIFMPRRLKNGFYPLHFMAAILSHRRDFSLLPHQCAKLCAQTVSCSCLAQNSVYALFCDVQAAFGAFHRIEKQPAHLGLLNLRFTRPWGGKFGFGNSACG